MERVLYCIIITTISNYIQKKLQLLLYIHREGGVDKSWIVNGIELGFSLYSHRADLVLTAPIGAAASNIEVSTIYICLEIGIKNNQGKTNKVSSI